MEQDEEYYPALEACYGLLTDVTYLQAMKTLFTYPANAWLNVKMDFLDKLDLEFHELFKKELFIFNITLDDLNDLSVMWSVPPDDQHDGMYLILFFNAENFVVSSAIYNYSLCISS